MLVLFWREMISWRQLLMKKEFINNLAIEKEEGNLKVCLKNYKPAYQFTA